MSTDDEVDAYMEAMTDLKDPGDSLAEALPREMSRVRDEVLAVYLTLGPGGVPAS